MGRLDKETFICIDCETTGLDTNNDRIIELAAVKFTFDHHLSQYDTLINPDCEIPHASTKIHNITDQMVKGMPKIEEVLEEFLNFVGDSIVVGHGVGFDIEVIANSAERSRINHSIRKNSVLDTLRMARLYGQSKGNSLQDLRKHFNVSFEGPHRALSDVVVNIEVFKHLAKPYNYVEQLFKVLDKPIAMKTMPLGKHKGRPIREVPLEYLKWAACKDFDRDLLFTIRNEINRRKKGDLFSQAGNPFQNL